MANSRDAHEYSFKRKSKGQVASSIALEEEMARVWAGLSISEYEALVGNPDWVNPFKPSRSKADIVAAYRMANLMEAIQNDMAAAK
jgi:hypothetical protein